MRATIELGSEENRTVLELEEGGAAYFGSREYADRFSPYAVIGEVGGYRTLTMRDGRLYVREEGERELEVREVGGDVFVIPTVAQTEKGKTEALGVRARIVFNNGQKPSGELKEGYLEGTIERLAEFFGPDTETVQ